MSRSYRHANVVSYYKDRHSSGRWYKTKDHKFRRTRLRIALAHDDYDTASYDPPRHDDDGWDWGHGVYHWKLPNNDQSYPWLPRYEEKPWQECGK